VLDGAIDGKPLIASGDYRGAEFAGATFSPVGDELFVNIQTPGRHLRHHRTLAARSALIAHGGQDVTNSRRSALSWSLCVSVMPCGAPS